jgi:mono/diheme cytochrome c family protein
MTRRNFRFLKLASVGVVGGALIWVSAQFAGAQVEMGAGGRIITGVSQYRTHCAQCHGTDGKGDGPVAPALKTPPTDLTMLSKNNGGVFPEQMVTESINGVGKLNAHGSADMPAWGLELRTSTKSGSGGYFTPEQVKKKIQLIVDYIKTIQQK